MADTQGEPSSAGFPPESSQSDSKSTLLQTVDIHIVSPTVGVPTLDFPSLPVETTMRQLKDRIQEALPSHPAHDQQRLIHRGRLLDPDDLSLRDIMTTDQLLSLQHQTIHLVVRGVADAQNTPSPAQTSQPRHQTPERPVIPQLVQDQRQHMAYELTMQARQIQAQQHHALQVQAQQMQQHHAREELLRVHHAHQMLAQQNHILHIQAQQRQQQYLRQNLSPQDRAWQQEQQERVRREVGMFAQYRYPGESEPPRGTGRPQGNQGASPSSSTSLSNRPTQPTQRDVTTQFSPGPPRQGDHIDTPDQSAYAGSGAVVEDRPVDQQLHPQTPLNQPEVYILSSPTGPRGLLIHGNADIYVTPSAVRRRPVPYQRTMPSMLYAWHVPTQPLRAPVEQGEQRAQQAQPQQQLRQAHGRRAPHQDPVRLQVHPNNAGVAPLVAAWPHIWLLVRLSVFVWWFSYNDPTWARWLTLTAIAAVVFLLNTGMLTGFANEAWEPFRQHLEGLIPLADPNRPQPEAAQAAPPVAAGHDAAGVPGETRGPNPGRMAARLVAERRVANGNWLLDHVRRLERAGLLFLASIAPGVAEGHIAHLEAQERAARQQREADAAAAAAAAAAIAVAAEQNSEASPQEAAHEEEQPPVEGHAAAEQQPLLVGEA
ncbi:hypothetical protein B0T18DRAFT_444459 [Schizothecium vesticola]|uniref:Ubiquitin-like domain-containing protein n=1 Tax=Schizothecium vesticola TaxID=314040 RepID=A0AA40F7B0_9PEZI|nr:hypothetical protein B0T18DRAFT_444459 [Schizothecium vesticola]